MNDVKRRRIKMNIKKIISLVMIVMLALAVPFTSFAEDDEDYFCDESAFVRMTPEEVSDELLRLGIVFDKIGLYSTGSLVEREVTVVAERDKNRIMIFFITKGSMVANEIGVKNLRLYENNIKIMNNEKMYTGFKQLYSEGYYYYSPVKGSKYYATGTNFAVFTTTEVALFTTSDTITY